MECNSHRDPSYISPVYPLNQGFIEKEMVRCSSLEYSVSLGGLEVFVLGDRNLQRLGMETFDCEKIDK